MMFSEFVEFIKSNEGAAAVRRRDQSRLAVRHHRRCGAPYRRSSQDHRQGALRL